MTDADLEDLVYLQDVQNVANRRYAFSARCAPLELVIEGDPKPSARARGKAGQRPYTPAKTRAAEHALTVTLRQAIRRQRAWEADGNWSLAVIFYRQTQRAVDGDNLVKLLKDAATKAHVWHDDSQCTHEDVTVDLDRERPRTVLRVARHTGTRMVR